MAQIYVAEVQAYNPALPGLVTLYFSTQRYLTWPTDTPANTPYVARIQQPANVQRTMFDGARTFGASKIGFGELELVNADGGLDYLINYGFDGRPITIKLGEVTEASAGVPTWTTVLKGTMEQPELSWQSMIIRVRDRQFELNKARQLHKYGGTNALPFGLDGVAGDLKGKPRPHLDGTAYNFSPPQCNTSHLIYELSDGLLTSVLAVYDQGAALTAGVARRLALIDAASAPLTMTVNAATDVCTTATHSYATGDPVTVSTSGTLPAPLVALTYYYVRVLSGTTFTLHTSAAGANTNTLMVNLTTTGTGTQTVNNNLTLGSQYDWVFDATGSYIRLGQSPIGQVTCDAVQGAASGNRTVAQLLKALLLDAGISSGDISAGDVTALDSACSYEVGYWTSHESEQTFGAVMDALANSIGAWYGQDRTGVFRMGRIVAPSGSSVATLTSVGIEKIDRVASADEGRGVPAWRVNLGYKRFFTPQTSDLAGTVGDARRSELREEYRRVSDNDPSVQTVHLLAPELTFDTVLISASDAAAEVTRRLGLYKVIRDRLEVRVRLNSSLAASVDLGSVVTVLVPRFGYNAGKQFLVIGIKTDLRGGMLELTLWG